MGKDAIVAGTGFEGRAHIIAKHVREGMPVLLQRDPSNMHDANAIAVFISVPRVFGLFGHSVAQIGFIKAGAAKGLAAKMDSGVQVLGFIKSFFAPAGKQHPRVSLRLEWPDD